MGTNLTIGGGAAATIALASGTNDRDTANPQKQIVSNAAAPTASIASGASGSLASSSNGKSNHIGTGRDTYTAASSLAPRLTEIIKSRAGALYQQIGSGAKPILVPPQIYRGHFGAAGFSVYKALLPHGSTFLTVPGVRSMTDSNLTSRLDPLVKALETSADQPSFKAFAALTGQPRVIANSLLLTTLETLSTIPGLSEADAKVALRESVTQIVESAQEQVQAASPRPVVVQRPVIGPPPADQALPPLAIPKASGGMRLADKVETKGNRSTLNLAGADLSKVTDLDSQLEQLRNANPRLKVVMTGANLKGLILKGANLHGVILNKADLSAANLSGADLSSTDLSETKLQANLAGANLRGATMIGANLDEANLRGADLEGVRLIDAHMSRAHLGGANLTYANLTGAYLPNADLQYSNLKDANLTGANLYRADLTGADLTRTTLDGAYLTHSIRPKNAAASNWLSLVSERGMTLSDRQSMSELMSQYNVPPSLRTATNEALLWADVRIAAQGELHTFQARGRLPTDLPPTDTGRRVFMNRIASTGSYVEFLKKSPSAYAAIANQRLNQRVISEQAYADLMEGIGNGGVPGPEQLEVIKRMPDSSGKRHMAIRAVHDVSSVLQNQWWTPTEVPPLRATFGPTVKYLTSTEALGTFSVPLKEGEPMRFKARVLDHIAEIENRLAAGITNPTSTAPYLAALAEVDEQIALMATGPYSNPQSDSLSADRKQAVALFQALRSRIEAAIPNRS
jgi:uncharacterized protein YjbI with pentapeptide repeats